MNLLKSFHLLLSYGGTIYGYLGVCVTVKFNSKGEYKEHDIYNLELVGRLSLKEYSDFLHYSPKSIDELIEPIVEENIEGWEEEARSMIEFDAEQNQNNKQTEKFLDKYGR